MPIRFKLKRLTQPDAEPVTLAEAQTHCRVDVVESDPFMQSLIKTARMKAETHCRRSFITSSWELLVTLPDEEIDLPMPDVQSVTEVKVVDPETGVESVLDASFYILIDNTLKFLNGVTVGSLVRIEYEAGYGDDPTDVPEPIKTAILAFISHLYNNREGQAAQVEYQAQASGADLPYAATLLSPYQLKRI